MQELVDKLTGKNQNDFEFAAAQIVNNSDVQSFEQLVKKSDFLFDFIKKNVNQRLSNAVNQSNYKNLFSFLKIYSPDYEDFIVEALVRFADEDLTDKMLELLEHGLDEEKAYAAKYFSHINDTLAIDFLRKNSYSDFDPLSVNCAKALCAMKDEASYNGALQKLSTDDEFEKLSAIRFLTAYGDKKALPAFFEAMKKSSMPEHIASEIPYLESFVDLLGTNFKPDTLLAFNHIISGLGEIVSLSQVFDFQMYDVLEKLVNTQKNYNPHVILNSIQNREGDKSCDPETSSGRRGENSVNALILLNAKFKFEQLTENDEYLFDESKEIKAEVLEITNFLNAQNTEFWAVQEDLFIEELSEDSEFVYSALDLVQELGVDEEDKLTQLLNSSNQTLILKTLETIKKVSDIYEVDKEEVLSKISDINIKAIIESLY